MAKDVVIIYSTKAQKELRQLDFYISSKIVKKVTKLSHASNPLVGAKALTGILSQKYRYRVGDYRIIFTYDDKGKVSVLNILKVGHRKDIYR